MQQLTLTTLSPSLDRPVEIVERKGIGHPDTVCDALAEELSRALCQFYLERFGLVMHHNVDKALLWGGTSEPAFGGGRVLAPMEIFLAGRATCEYKDIKVPVEELVRESCSNWLRAHTRLLDIGLKYAGADLAIEFPFSGYGPLTDAAGSLADHVIARIGERNRHQSLVPSSPSWPK